MGQIMTHDEAEKPQLDVKDKSMNKHLGKVNEKMGFMRGSSLSLFFVICLDLTLRHQFTQKMRRNSTRSSVSSIFRMNMVPALESVVLNVGIAQMI
jgi:hypothetical protein